jgi:hypothetical protein
VARVEPQRHREQPRDAERDCQKTSEPLSIEHADRIHPPARPRAAQRLGLRSDAFWRQESASMSMSMTWQCWARRSTSATTQAAPGKMVPHCLKARLVVMTIERCSCRRLTIL